MDKRKLLSQSVLFSTLSEAQVSELSEFASETVIEEGETVFTKGSDGDELYVLASGQVSVELKGKDGKSISLGVLSKGDTFGEISVLDGSKRSASVKAVLPCEALAIRRDDLFKLIHRVPDIAIRLLGVLAERMRMTDRLIEDTLSFNLPSKAAKELLGLAKAYGQNTSGGIRINADFSDSELANIVGTTEQKLDEQLRQWQQQGIIAISRGHITLVDVRALENLA